MRWLILLVDGAAVDMLGAEVVHATSGRLVIAEAVSADQFTEHPAVVAVTERALPEALTGQLTESEAIFAAAFAARKEKPDRIGDGLPWDAAGYEPPDAPHDINAESGERATDQRGDDDG